MGLRELITDVWSWLDYKPAMTDPRRPGRNTWAELTRSWVPDEDLRRLAAYRLLAAYDSNQAGQVAAVTGDDDAGTERRELGDASKLVDTALGYLLGSEQTITVAGAEHADEEPNAEAAMALAVQERLRDWAEKELLPLRLQQAERTAILLGDAVYTLAWEPEKGRVLLRTWDPGLYFPEWPEDGEQDGAEFPLRVHLAWELPEDERRGLKARLRRVTYELGPIGPASRRGTAKDGSPAREYLYAGDGEPVLVAGDTLNAETGVITRNYPWAPNRPSPWTCYLTDAEWQLDDLKGSQLLYDLPLHKAKFRVRSDGEVLDRLDLMADFIPVIHITNSIPASGEHWGKPTLATVLQAVDELSATDTDSSGASATTGSPIIGLAGARLPIDRATGQPLPVKVRAGTVWQLNDNGRMDVLDTSAQLAELRARVDHILDRIAANSRLTAAGLGTLDPTALPSGYALQLALGPLDTLVAAMRLARTHKYAVLLRMVQRLHQAGQAQGWPAGESLPARLMWGPHTPTDRAAVLDEVVKGVGAGVLSVETGVRMLIDAGYPIDDAQTEIERIQARAFEAAGRLADATGDNAAVREYLGLPEADPDVSSVPLVPPAEGR
ncbi:hypothetical protein [Streptomyces djakartensis]|uniref:Phage portal protein n=1 Tax=Streptomyces djakartensis TaxID=68193 RepID=A0ABQ2ZH37_9ACTN|nr:hypothetical protein [Streptomyces djakartensis]GGY12768.1 hypothetical protein GCM10010384_17730 [Streptomyces djakartensis]